MTPNYFAGYALCCIVFRNAMLSTCSWVADLLLTNIITDVVNSKHPYGEVKIGW